MVLPALLQRGLLIQFLGHLLLLSLDAEGGSLDQGALVLVGLVVAFLARVKDPSVVDLLLQLRQGQVPLHM